MGTKPPPLEQPDEPALATRVAASVRAWAAAAVGELDPEGLELVRAALSDDGSDLCVEVHLRAGCIALVATDARYSRRHELIAQRVGGEIHPDGQTAPP
jgi:hypothetical protein